MYTVAVERDFIAEHFLFGGDWGAENSPHAHHYVVEVRLKGAALDQHGYLTDIVDIEAILDGLVRHYRDKLLNGLPEFAGINPSIEHFARILCEGFTGRLIDSNGLDRENLSSEHGEREGEAPVALPLEGATRVPVTASCLSTVEVKIWENRIAWASYMREL